MDYIDQDKKRRNHLKGLSLKSLIGMDLQGDYDDLDWCPAAEIRSRGNPETITCMKKLFKSRNWKKRSLAMYVMGQLYYIDNHNRKNHIRYGIEDSKEMLVAGLADPNPCVIAVALSGLSHTPVPEALPTMLTFVDHPHVWCRQKLAVALSHFIDEGPHVTNALLKLATDDFEETRDWATCDLQYSQVDTPEVRECLWRNAHDEDSLVVDEAMHGLARRKDKRVVALIQHYMKNGNYCDDSSLLEVAELYGDSTLVETVKKVIISKTVETK